MAARGLLLLVIVANILVLVLSTVEDHSSNEGALEKSSKGHDRSPYTPTRSRPGHTRRKSKRCRRGSKCGKGEEFSTCIQSIGRAQYCTEKNQKIDLTEIDEKTCKKGCVCKVDYLRAENGTCIPKDQCEIKCCANEVLNTCPGPCKSDKCPKKENENADCVGAAVCLEPACTCAFNHRRADNGTCIPTRSCPPFDCSARPNEEFDPCPPLCPTDDCSQASPSGKCPLPGRIGIVLNCNPKCRCIKGYWRNNGTCVPHGQCPGVCPANERYSGCIQGECVALTCDQKDKSISCPRIRPEDCKQGCVCAENYLRAANSTCVPKDQCESKIKCGDNEVLDNCPGPCKSDKCPKKENENADCVGAAVCLEPACTCAFNHRRADNGTCIPTRSCPPFDCSARPNEEFDPCPPLCPTDDCSQASPSGKCPLPGRIGIVLNCNPKCRCIKGYWRSNGTCVPYGQCPGVCPANERYSGCIQGECVALTCDQKDKSISCPRIRPEYCKQGCVCEENYLRAANGTCVPKDQCESELKCGDNEVVDNCPGPCKSDKCPKKENENADCVGAAVCLEPACTCAFNHRRADNGTCIPTRSCPPFDCSARPNEEFDPCPPLCPTDDCSQASPSGKCPAIGRIGIVLNCNPKCRCIKGYWRNNGTCVPYGQCPGVCPANERYSGCIQGECVALTCDQKDKSIPCPRIRPEDCKQGCVCEENYLRAANGTCVPKDQCESELKCGDNEVVDNCPGPCKSDKCPKKENENADCVGAAVCLEPACTCAFNHRRADNGTCIPTRSCPPFDCSARPNEEFDPCPPLCPTDDCSQASPSGKCPLPGRIGIVLNCNPKCRCIKGYWRNNGTCVPYGQCPGVCPANERYSGCIQGECVALTCDQKDKSIPCPRIRPEDCKQGCVCEENYLRAANGTCVPKDQCETNTCPINEEYVPCIQGVCRAMNCVQKGQDVPCPDIPKEICDSGCICKEQFLRNDYGTCVPEDQCPSNVCPLNEQWSTCKQARCRAENCTQRGTPIACPGIAEGSCIEGCVCQDDYLRDENGLCVPEDQCPADVCPANEVFSECTQAVCRAQQCSQRGLPVPCPGIAAGSCIKGCVCQENYLRDDNGNCIPADQCYAGLCPINEEYIACTQAIRRPTNCSQRGHQVYYPESFEPCEGGCVCNENFLRTAEGNCVLEDNCGNITCFNNEVLDSCAQDCTSDYCPFSSDSEERCYKPEPCKPQCKCAFNYRRSIDGTCIETTDCPPFDCSDRPNEEYNPCPPYCPSDECSLPRVKGQCPFRIGVRLECNPKCQCKEGYGRVNGICVPYEECPDLCPINEEYSSCVQATCRAQNCTDRDALLPCPGFAADSCKRGCICKENYYRNEIGKCVSYEQCASPVCPEKYEEYTSTKRGCPPNTCISLVAKFRCAENQIEEPGCVCQSGYLRINETSPCIPICQCPQMVNSCYCIEKTVNIPSEEERDLATTPTE